MKRISASLKALDYFVLPPFKAQNKEKILEISIN